MSKVAKIDNRVVPAYLNEKFFEKSLQHEFKIANIKIVQLSIEYATSGGDNYTSDILRATIKYKCVQYHFNYLNLNTVDFWNVYSNKNV